MKKHPATWKPSKGDIVEITALDHVQDDDEYLFKCWGRVVKVTRVAISVLSWAPSDPETAVDLTNNSATQFTIVRKAIEEIRRLR